MFTHIIIIQPKPFHLLNSLPANADFCLLQITFANSIEPDQAVGPGLVPNYLTF